MRGSMEYDTKVVIFCQERDVLRKKMRRFAKNLWSAQEQNADGRCLHQ